MRRSSVAALPIALIFCGAVLSLSSARSAEPVPDHTLGAAAWPGLPDETRALIEALARDLYEESGGLRPHYDRLPIERKAAYRGTAMRSLGLEARSLAKGWV